MLSNIEFSVCSNQDIVHMELTALFPYAWLEWEN